MSEPQAQPDVTYMLREVAKTTGIGYKKMLQLLKSYKILLPGNPGDTHKPNPIYVRSGHFIVQEREFTHPNLGKRIYYTTMVTAKGLAWLSRRLHEYRIGKDGEA